MADGGTNKNCRISRKRKKDPDTARPHFLKRNYHKIRENMGARIRTSNLSDVP